MTDPPDVYQQNENDGKKKEQGLIILEAIL